MDKTQKIRNLIGNENACEREYFLNGPDGMAQFLGVSRNSETWKEIFSYFVFEKNLVYKCAIEHIEVVQQILAFLGPMELRKLMGIESSEFNSAFESIFDIAGLSCRSFYRYAVSRKKELVEMMLNSGPEAFRKNLCISGAKYDNLWEALMDLLVEEFSKEKIRERMGEHNRVFKKIMPRLGAYLKAQGLF